MEFSMTEEQKMLKDAAKRFFKKECPISLVKEMMTDEVGYVPEVWKKMAEFGWLGLVFGEDYGGSGGDFMDLIVLMEEMGRAMPPVPFFSSVILGGLILLEGGGNAVKTRYLPPLCKGDLMLTLALTETEGKWTSRSIQTNAEKSDGGYLLTGRKMFVPDAGVADLVFVAARTGEEDENITLLGLDPKSSGVTLNPLVTIGADKQFEMVFDQVKILEDQRVGLPGEGWAIIERVWPKIISARCAEMVGGMAQCIEMTVTYAKQREQFGVPIGSFQVIQHHCVDMLLQLETARFLTYQSAWRASKGLESVKQAAMAKAMCSESFNRIAATAHQIHGAIGFSYEHDLHIFSKRAKGWELMMGTPAEHRAIVAREMHLQG